MGDSAPSVWGFPWTTGTVVAMAPPRAHSTGTGTGGTLATLSAKGWDKRTPQGRGQLQRVTPFVVRKRERETGERLQARAGIAVVSLRFAPEASSMLQLAAGLAGLGPSRHLSPS